MDELVRADALRSYPDLVAELGGDARALLREAGLSPQVLSEADGLLPFRAMLRLLELSAERLVCSDFGLRLAARQKLDIFGPVALAAQNCDTLREAIECFTKYFHTHNPALKVVLRTLSDRRTVRLGVSLLLTRPPPHRQLDERNVLLAQQALRLLSEESCRPQRILLPHSRSSTVATYRQYFRCPVLFEQDGAAVEIFAQDLQKPIRGQSPQLRRIATAFLDGRGTKAKATLSLRVREVIKPLLPSGRCNYENLADALHMHPRTLQRRLAGEGTTFEAIRDEVRREVAEHYLTASVLPLSQVTALLGYSEQSALTRSCQRWFHRAPLVLRRQLAALH